MEGGSDFVALAMGHIGTVFDFITDNAYLAAIALGFPVVRAAAGALRRVIRS